MATDWVRTKLFGRESEYCIDCFLIHPILLMTTCPGQGVTPGVRLGSRIGIGRELLMSAPPSAKIEAGIDYFDKSRLVWRALLGYFGHRSSSWREV